MTCATASPPPPKPRKDHNFWTKISCVEEEIAITAPNPDTEGSSRFYRWMFTAAIVLSLATLASAWASYQASNWSAEVGRWTQISATYRIKSVAASDVANRHLTTDIILFADWFQAEVEGRTAVADELRIHFRPEFREPFEEWLATASGNELPAGTPFDLNYVIAAEVEAEQLTQAAEDAVEKAEYASTVSGRYVLTAVLYASVLFLAGIASKIAGVRAQQLTIILAGIAFVIAIVFMFSQPILN